MTVANANAGLVSIIPGAVQTQVLEDRVSTPAPSVSVEHLSQWLHERMRSHRVALAQHVEEQQKMLLLDFHAQCGVYSSARSVIKPSMTWTSSKSFAMMTSVNGVPLSHSDIESSAGKGAHDEQIITFGEPIVELQSTAASNVKKRFSDLLASLTHAPTHEGELEVGRFKRIEDFVQGQTFEMLCVGVISLNAILIALEQQYQGLSTGYKLGFRSYSTAAEDLWPSAPQFFETLDKIFVSIFILEIALRLVGTRRRWFLSLWNYLDVFIIGLTVASWAFHLMNPSFVRLVRFAKLIRILRVMRSNRLIESLKLLSASIQASFNTLCVSLFVLLLIHTVAAMSLSQLVEPFINDARVSVETRKEVFAHYGTFWRSMITMFEITFANWAPTCRLLVDHVSEWFGIFFLVYRCVVGFAMLSVIQAVFIQQTMKSAQLDDEFMVQQKSREKEVYAAKLQRVFEHLDTSGDGQVSWDEFSNIVSDKRMKLIMSTLEVDTRDLEGLFHMLADDEGRITPDEFITGLQRIKGPAQALDLVTLLGVVRRLESKLLGSKSRSFNPPKSKSFRREQSKRHSKNLAQLFDHVEQDHRLA